MKIEKKYRKKKSILEVEALTIKERKGHILKERENKRIILNIRAIYRFKLANNVKKLILSISLPA